MLNITLKKANMESEFFFFQLRTHAVTVDFRDISHIYIYLKHTCLKVRPEQSSYLNFYSHWVPEETIFFASSRFAYKCMKYDSVLYIIN